MTCYKSVIIHLLPQQLQGISVATEQLLKSSVFFFLSIVRNEVHNTLTPPKPHISSAISTTKGVFHKHPYQQI